MIYIFSWFFLYLIGYLNSIERYKNIFFIPFLFVFFTLIVILRGEVGTDTIQYEIISSYLKLFNDKVEIGFSALVVFIKYFTTDTVLIVRILSFILVIVFMIFYFTSKKDERFVIYYFLFPIFFFSFAMNGIRAGFALLFFYFAIRLFFDKKYLKMLVIILISISFHYSITIVYIFLLSIYYKILSLKSLFISLFILIVLYFNPYFYIEKRISGYFNYDTPSIFSGVSTIIIVFFIIFAIKLSDLKDDIKKQIIITSIIFLSIFYIIAIYSYAGLRLLDLIKYSLPIIFIYYLRQEKIELNKNSKIFIVLAGFVAIVFLFRNFIQSIGQKSAFLPYSTFF